MRSGTWNLDGNWSPTHHVFMQNQMCDVWLLTEVPEVESTDVVYDGARV